MAHDEMKDNDQDPPEEWIKRMRSGGRWENVPEGTNVKVTIGGDTVLDKTVPSGKKANVTMNFFAEIHSV